MSEFNPYQIPSSDVSVVDDPQALLAGRDQRFAAALVDGLLGLALAVPVMFVMGVFEYTLRGEEPPFALTLSVSVFGFLAFIALHFVLLKKYGQTIGKWLLKIRIADLNGDKPDLKTILLKRYLPIHVVGQIPVVGLFLALADVLLIFRKDRRCAHDLIAETQVLRVTGS